WNFVNCGAYDVKAQRPSLGQDPATGHLYCAYQVYDTDTLHLSHAGCPSGETYLSVSMDGGMNWSVGANVTQTITAYRAPAGRCKSELTPSLAKLVDGNCHLSYVFDRDAGCYIQYQGEAVLNPVIYHRVPAGQIPVLPFVAQNVPFHVEHAAPATPLSISLIPIISPIVIPANGGSFDFYAFVTNGDSVARATDLWTSVVLPGNISFGPLLGPVEMTLLPGVQSWYRVQRVPASAPAGNYTYRGYLGDYPSAIEDSDCVTFAKAYDLEVGCGADDWLNSGDLLTTAAASGSGEFRLLGVHPNPLNLSTVLSFELREASFVKLGVYDVSGRLVAELVDGWRDAGSHSAVFDGTNLASGIYVYRMTAGSFEASGKMVLVK
ncbi:MAG TPA: T9SS type A sorting domain-containing protein, partial [bacterium]